MIVSKEVRVLLIEDSEDDAILLERVLRKDGLAPIIEQIHTSEEMKRALEEKTWDVILCDYSIPAFSIPDAMNEIAQRELDIPFIIVSGTISDEIAVEMMKSGAHDYLTKNNLSRLVPAIEREIEEADQRKKRRMAEEALRTAHNVALLYQDITGHDIRNYLQAILIASDLLSSDETDPKKISLIDHISESVNECSELICSVQTTASLLFTPLEKMSIDFTLESCIESFKREYKKATIYTDITAKNAVIEADKFLNHLILNVLSNAVKHNSSDDKHVWIHLGESDEGYELKISDNGPGITDDHKRNLMNPERRAGGVGILQCVQIAKKYRGSFEILDRVEGDSAQGAAFRLWLPKAI
ncbi:MAG: sensor histidine kinase [Candidatus Thorarchaeota archaeon]